MKYYFTEVRKDGLNTFVTIEVKLNFIEKILGADFVKIQNETQDIFKEMTQNRTVVNHHISDYDEIRNLIKFNYTIDK